MNKIDKEAIIKGERAGEGFLHLNDNILCAIDCETTGLRPGYHDLIQICILPLDAECRPSKKYYPFNFYLTPKRPENIDYEAMTVNQVKLAELMVTGIDPDKACDLFDEWFKKFGFAANKKIAPLAHNWAFDRGFLIDWLGGPKNMETYFHYHARDTMCAALFAQDKAYFQGNAYPFAKVNLQYLATTLKVETHRAHDALSDCITTAEVYRRMLLSLQVGAECLSPSLALSDSSGAQSMEKKEN